MGIGELKFRLKRHSTLDELRDYISNTTFDLDGIAKAALNASPPCLNVRSIAEEYLERLLESCVDRFGSAIRPMPDDYGARSGYSLRRTNEGVLVYMEGRQIGKYGEVVLLDNPEVCAAVELSTGESGHNMSKYLDGILERHKVITEMARLPSAWFLITPKNPRSGKARHLDRLVHNNGYVAFMPYSHGDFLRAIDKAAQTKQETPEKDITPLPYIKPDVHHGDDVKQH